jgi:hypothetical protein
MTSLTDLLLMIAVAEWFALAVLLGSAWQAGAWR